MSQINKILSNFRTEWNKRCLRTAAGKSPEQLYVGGMLSSVRAAHTSIDALYDDTSVIASSYGIGWEGLISYGNEDVDIPVSEDN